ncbi:MFS transporter [Paenibacillus sp. UNC499MF]|uniref:staphylopine family metallophore export MFS transporter CntE n=1 Tax=Paenibacillus sp. UNC499MF TaxID=1502751 RepID=UPI00089F8D75|nr:MFS transporter [Paenibacillus sp. UNC499MF]SEG67110.1 Predicted arabinose efflux permease, MFS family [Paenibacillus sp. UNC499MF]
MDNPYSFRALQVYAVTILFYCIVYMVLMILPFYAITAGAGEMEIGLIMGTTMFASMICRPLAGSVIDRYGTRKIFVLALLLFTVSLAGYFIPNLWLFGLVRAVQGIVAAFFSTAMEIITMDLLSEKMRAQGLSLYSLATMIPSTFGPTIALLLKDWLPMTWIFGSLFMMSAGIFLFGLSLSRQMKPESAVPAAEAEDEPAASPLARKGVWKSRALLLSSAVMLLASVANGAIFTFLPLYLEKQGLKFAELYFLIQTLVLVLTRFAGRKYIPSDGSFPGRILFPALALACLGSLILGTSLSPAALSAAAVFNGIAFALLYPSLLTYVSFSVPHFARGLLIGLFIGAADLGFSLGALAMGPVAYSFSFPVMFITGGALCFLAGLAGLGFRVRRKEQGKKTTAAGL